MVHTYTLAYLRTRSLPELFTLRFQLQQKLVALPQRSPERSEVAQVLSVFTGCWSAVRPASGRADLQRTRIPRGNAGVMAAI
ncbi:hypothetical protein ACOJBM_24835 [Rhizobium beringeri]